jgi:hypothetical protein
MILSYLAVGGKPLLSSGDQAGSAAGSDGVAAAVVFVRDVPGAVLEV